MRTKSVLLGSIIIIEFTVLMFLILWQPVFGNIILNVLSALFFVSIVHYILVANFLDTKRKTNK